MTRFFRRLLVLMLALLMPVAELSSVAEKYIFARLVSVNDCEPAVSVVPLMDNWSCETDTDALVPSVNSNVR